MNLNEIKIVFFGTSEFSVDVLETLASRGIVPDVIITQPDRPQGRKMLLTPPPVKVWAEKNNKIIKEIKIFQPEKLDEDFIKILKAEDCELFILASYGKIIPKKVLDLPLHNTLNIHPSLLPKYRGASPLQSMILADDHDTGVTVMLMDEEMDHGPIVAQKKISADTYSSWPPAISEMSTTLARAGAELLADILPEWINVAIKPTEQDHSQATFTKKISKQDGELKISPDDTSEEAYKNFLKIQAFTEWPTAYFFATPAHKHDSENPAKLLRIIIKKASFVDGKLIIERVIPEGGKEIDFRAEDFKL